MQSKRLKLKKIRLSKRRSLNSYIEAVMAIYKREAINVDLNSPTYPRDFMLQVEKSIKILKPKSKIWNEWCKRNNPPKPIYLDEYKRLL